MSINRVVILIITAIALIYVWSRLNHKSVFANAHQLCSASDTKRTEVYVSKLMKDFDSELCIRSEGEYLSYAEDNPWAPHLAPHSVSSLLSYSVLHGKTSSYETAEYYISAESQSIIIRESNFVGARGKREKGKKPCWRGKDKVKIVCSGKKSVYIEFQNK